MEQVSKKEILNALRIIKKVCKEQNEGKTCEDCPFWNIHEMDCTVSPDWAYPCNWNINCENADTWRAFL